MHSFSLCYKQQKHPMKYVFRTLALIPLSGTTTFIPLRSFLRATTCIFFLNNNIDNICLQQVFQNILQLFTYVDVLDTWKFFDGLVRQKNDKLPYATFIPLQKYFFFNFSLLPFFYSWRPCNISFYFFYTFKRFFIRIHRYNVTDSCIS